MYKIYNIPVVYIIIGVFLFGIIIYLITRKQEPFVNEPTTSSSPIISYWNKYMKSDTRSKCFDCDRTSKYRHGSQCIDCETEGGKQVDTLLNRVLTR
jgi:hypothetical protein